MSRFSPNTWLDAVQLPFAMVQFSGNVYVEPIAPDIRPAAFVILSTVAIIGILLWGEKDSQKGDFSDWGVKYVPRSAWALICASALALILWIMSSANGRYGLVALTLSPLAAIAALLIAFRSSRLRTAILIFICVAQGIFIATADPDDTWSKLTPFQWDKEVHADLLPQSDVYFWREKTRNQSVLVVTTQTLTGMSTLYQVFGPQARYISLGYISQFPRESIEQQRALQLIKSSDAIYWSNPIMAMPINREKKYILGSMVAGKSSKLKEFGLEISDNQKCPILPERMGAKLQICPVIKDMPIKDGSQSSLPERPSRYLKDLAAKCPHIFGGLSPIEDNKIGGVVANAHDGKYFIEVLQDMSVYIRHSGDTEHRIVLLKEQANSVGDISCDEIIKPGEQYWRQF